MLKTLLLATLLVGLVSIAIAQTNGGFVAANGLNVYTNGVLDPSGWIPDGQNLVVTYTATTTTAQDWSKALGDIGVHVTAATMVIALGILIPLIKSLAAYARKLIPDSWQVNKAGLTLANLAGEVNPTIQKLQTFAAEEQAAKTAPKTS